MKQATNKPKTLQRFNHLAGEIGAVYHEAAVKFGLSDSSMQILYTLCAEGEACRIQDICLQTGTSKQTINSALRKLEHEDIIYLEARGERSKWVHLTPKGESFVQKTVMHVVAAENRIFDAWSAQQCADYMHLTEKYLYELQQEVEKL